MARGIIYVMSTAVDGLVKIGKTGSDNFEQRMSQLEGNGYRNVTGLLRRFAIELDNYDEKELLLHSLFSRSQVGNTELFSMDVNEVIQLLSSFEGVVVFPKEKKSEVFEQATEAVETNLLPDGEYFMVAKLKDGRKNAKATMVVSSGSIRLKKGSAISSVFECKTAGWIQLRSKMPIKDGYLLDDFACSSPSMAAALVVGQNRNGWSYWKDASGKVIDVFRQGRI
ncbi:MAG: DUF4357 domain-containing protein [Candidatus Enteromonas sp.]